MSKTKTDMVLARWDAAGINADDIEARRVINAVMAKGKYNIRLHQRTIIMQCIVNVVK